MCADSGACSLLAGTAAANLVDVRIGHFALAIFPAFAFLLIPPRVPVASSSLTMDFDQIPYLHRSTDAAGGPTGIRFEGAVRLVSYELSAQALVPGDTLNVALNWIGVGDSYTATVQLVSPAALRYEVQPLAEVEAPAPASAAGLDLHLPADTPRGVYLLQVRLFAPSGELHAPHVCRSVAGASSISSRCVSLRDRRCLPIWQFWRPSGQRFACMRRQSSSRLRTVCGCASTGQ